MRGEEEHQWRAAQFLYNSVMIQEQCYYLVRYVPIRRYSDNRKLLVIDGRYW